MADMNRKYNYSTCIFGCIPDSNEIAIPTNVFGVRQHSTTANTVRGLGMLEIKDSGQQLEVDITAEGGALELIFRQAYQVLQPIYIYELRCRPYR